MKLQNLKVSDSVAWIADTNPRSSNPISNCLTLSSSYGNKCLQPPHVIFGRWRQRLPECHRHSFWFSLRPIRRIGVMVTCRLMISMVDRMGPIHDRALRRWLVCLDRRAQGTGRVRLHVAVAMNNSRMILCHGRVGRSRNSFAAARIFRRRALSKAA